MKEEMKIITGEETLVLQEPQTETKENEVLFEDTSKRSANVKHFRMKDGSFMAAIYDKPVHYLDEATGKYQDIPHDVTEQEDCYETKNHQFKATFPKKWGKKKCMTMERNGHKVSWRYVPTDSHRKNAEVTVREKKQKGKMEVSEFPSMFYAGAESYVDVEYSMTDNGVKENLVVQKAPRKKAPNKFRFSMDFGDLTPVLSKDKKQIDLMSGEEVVLQIPKPNMKDATGAYSEDGYYELQKEADGTYTMTLMVSEEWMQDNMRAFPVVIDPAIEIPGGEDMPTLTMVTISSDGTKQKENSHFPLVGVDEENVESRVYTKISPLSKIALPAGYQVTQATMHLYQKTYANPEELCGVAVQKVTKSWSKSNLSWENQPDISSTITDTFATVSRNVSDPVKVDITQLVKDWYATGNSYGFVMKIRESCKHTIPVSQTSEVSAPVGRCIPEDSGSNSGCNNDDGTTCTVHPNYVQFFSVNDNADRNPVLTITYQPDDAYTDNQKYETFEIGRAGKGSVNLFNGSFTFVHADIATKGVKLPISLSHIFHKGQNEESVSDFTYGRGWMLSASQKVFLASSLGIEAVYRDASGRHHYFVKNEDDTITDQTGLGLTFQQICNEETEGESTECYCIFDRADNKMYFNADGNLVKMQNPQGNESNLTYENGKLTEITDGVGNAVTLEYDGETGRLSSITDVQGRKIEYGYTISDRLACITYPDGEETRFVYDGQHRLHTIKDQSGMKYTIDYDDSSRVYQITQQGTLDQIKAGTTATEETVYGARVKFTYGDRSTAVRDRVTGREVVYCFDENGRVKCTYEDIVSDNSVAHGLSTNTIINEYVNFPNEHNDNESTYAGKYCSLSGTVHNNGEGAQSLLKNGTFASEINHTIYPDHWEMGVVDADCDGVDTTVYDRALMDRLKSFQFDNTNRKVARYMSQTVNLCDVELNGNLLLASAWAKAGKAVSSSTTGNSNAKFELYAKVTYEDGGEPTEYTAQFDSGRTGWQYVAAPLLLERDRKPVQAYVKLNFSQNEGTCHFCNVRLTVENAVATYYECFSTLGEREVEVLGNMQAVTRIITKYDKSATVTEYQNRKFDSVRTELKDADGNVFVSYGRFDYQHNPIYQQDYRGIVTETTYNNYGNPEYRKVYHKDHPEKYMKSATTYKTSQNFVKREYDSRDTLNGVDLYTEYDYKEPEGLLKSRTETNGQTYNYTYDANTDAMTKVTSVVNGQTVKNNFSYTKGFLTGVEQNGFTYNFVYDGLGRTKSIGIGSNTLAEMAYTLGEESTEQITYANGDCVKVTKDSRGNPVNKTFNGTVVAEASYDELGKPVKIVDKVKNVCYDYAYNLDGNVICKQETSGNNSFMDIFAYDNSQRMTKRVYGALGHIYNFFYETDERGKMYPDNVINTIQLTNRFTDTTAKDKLGRLEARDLTLAGKTSPLLCQTYSYLRTDRETNYVSGIVRAVRGDYVTSSTLSYTYDAAGNIETVKQDNQVLVKYQYDGLNRLIREDNYQIGRGYVWSYDNGGNILSKKEYTLPAEDGHCTLLNTYYYIYRASGWRDQMLAYNGKACSYDAVGNPVVYKDQDLTWTKVRQLASYGNNTFQYGADGIRYKKNNTVYTLDGSKILQETDGTKTIKYYYGHGGVVGFNYNGTDYYYEKNLQGDITAIYNTSGLKLAEYVYDAWGKILSMTDSAGNDISNNTSHVGYLNSFRYRGYYYDVETDLYYLESRYYDPETGRFLNADSLKYLGKGTELSNYNLYAYCGDNPVMSIDPKGNGAIAITTLIFIGSIIAGVIAAGYTAATEIAHQEETGRSTLEIIGNTILAGLSMFMFCYTYGMSAYGMYVSICQYNGYTPVTQIGTPQVTYPPNNGFNGDSRSSTLAVGSRIERTGSPYGRFVAPANTSQSALSLPPDKIGQTTTQYEVLKPIQVQAGTATPWFDQSGGGTQFLLEISVQELIDDGYLNPLS